MREIHIRRESEPAIGLWIRRRQYEDPAAHAVPQSQLYVTRRKQNRGAVRFLNLKTAVEQLTRGEAGVFFELRQHREQIAAVSLTAIGTGSNQALRPRQHS